MDCLSFLRKLIRMFLHGLPLGAFLFSPRHSIPPFGGLHTGTAGSRWGTEKLRSVVKSTNFRLETSLPTELPSWGRSGLFQGSCKDIVTRLSMSFVPYQWEKDGAKTPQHRNTAVSGTIRPRRNRFQKYFSARFPS